jgi:hypothetical protein
MVSGATNSILKLAFQGPRPYWYDERVVAHTTESSFGVPSGHSQNGVVFWGTIAAWIGRPWAWITAIAIVFLIGLSRMYLGVHFPHDVLVGWAVGALLLWAFTHWEAPALAAIKRRSFVEQILIALAVSLALILIAALVRFSLQGWQVPESWQQLAAQADPDADPIDPLALAGVISNAAVFFGLATGAIILQAGKGFVATGPLWQRAARFLLGIVGVLAIWAGLDAVFPGGESLLAYVLRYLRYSLVGLWISALAPLIFIRLRLAAPERN